MSEKAPVPESKPVSADAPATPTPPRRSPGHRGQDVRDTVAEMAARAHEISLEAGSKMAAAMKDVINAAAGLTGFAVESARDLVQYMVRRGQMTQDEADKLIREAEEAHGKRNPGFVPSRPTADHSARPAPKLVEKPVEKPIEKPAAVAVPAKVAAPAPAPVVVPPPAPAAAPVAAPKVAAAKSKPAPAAKKVAAPAKKAAAPAKGAVKRPAVAKASAKPAKKK